MPLAPAIPPFEPVWKPIAPQRLAGILRSKALIPADLVDEIAEALGDGLWDLAWTVASVTEFAVLESLRASLAEILEEGGTVRDWLSMLDDLGWRSPLGEWHERTIFRTTLGHVMEAERYDQVAGSEAVDFLVYDAIDDDRVREEHLALDGMAWPREEFPAELWPPNGYNCFLPSTVVSGSFIAGARASYAGRVVRLKTLEGRELSVTANHPVATARGMIPAHEIREGDHLVSYRAQVEPHAAVPPGSADHHEDGPAEIHQVFHALREGGSLCRLEAGPEDFHGDALRFESQVDVAMLYRELLHDGDTAAAKLVGDLGLEAMGMSEVLHEGDSSAQLPLEGVSGAAPSAPGGGELPIDTPPVAAHRRPLESLRFGSTANLDAALAELSRERRARDAGFYGELLHRLPGAIALDQVVEVVEGDWSGHVYDLQSVSGHIVAQGILCSNCRCSVIPADEADLEALEARLQDGPAPLDAVDEGFRAAPSVRGLSTELMQDLATRIRTAGWQVHPRLTPHEREE
ncbi:MAG: phage minor head protein [Acidobacteriota bacterium]